MNGLGWTIKGVLVAIVVVVGLAAAGPAVAQETAWMPPEPAPDAKDWIKLTSGEWLRGNIDLFRDEKLYFDSDELDDLEIDWGDVAEIRSPQRQTLTFASGEVVTGTIAMRDGVIKVTTEAGVKEFKRSDLMSLLEGRPRELNFWSFKATLGLMVRSGNTEQVDGNTYLRLRREATRSKFNLDYTGNLGSTQNEESINNHRIGATFDIFVSRKLFLTPLGGELFADSFQNIDYRATAGVGFGYYLWRQSKFEWFLSLSGAYQAIRYVSVQPGEDQRTETGVAVPNLNIDWDITGDIEFELDYNSQIGVPETKNTFHYVFALLSIELSTYLDLDTTFQWNHNENPVADAEGNVPERDDFRYSIGIGVDI